MATMYKIKRKSSFLGRVTPPMYHTNIFYKIYNQTVSTGGGYWEWTYDANGNINGKTDIIPSNKVVRTTDGELKKANIETDDRPATDKEIINYMNNLLGI